MNNETLREKIVAHYEKLDFNGKIIFLANVAERLTLDGRAIEEATASDEAAKMRTVIEALHRVIVQLHRMLASDARYPDDVFSNVLADQLERLKFSDAAIRGLIR